MEIQKSQSGMTTIEIVVAAAIAVIVFLGVAEGIRSFNQSIKLTQARTAAEEIRELLMTAMREPNSWNNTIADTVGNPTMGCLLNRTSCVANVDTALVLRDPLNAIVLDGRLTFPSTAAANLPGFSPNAAPCATFDGLAGNPQCPFTYSLSWRAVCAGGASQCVNPEIRIIGTFAHMPGPGQGSIVLQSAQYNIDYLSSAEYANEPVIIAEQIVGNGFSGTCGPGAWNRFRNLNVVIADPGRNVTFTSNSPADGVFILARGNYTCYIIAPAFGVDGFQIRLRNITAGTIAASSEMAFSPKWLQAVAVISTSVNTLATNSFIVEQNCPSGPAVDGGGVNTQWDLGLPVPNQAGVYSSPTTLAMINCNRVN